MKFSFTYCFSQHVYHSLSSFIPSLLGIVNATDDKSRAIKLVLMAEVRADGVASRAKLELFRVTTEENKS